MPPLTELTKQEWKETLKELSILHQDKGGDYGSRKNTYANLCGSEEVYWRGEPIDAWVGCFIRLLDKIFRIKTYLREGRLLNEGVEEALRDLAVYAIIDLVLYRRKTYGKRDSSIPNLTELCPDEGRPFRSYGPSEIRRTNEAFRVSTSGKRTGLHCGRTLEEFVGDMEEKEEQE